MTAVMLCQPLRKSRNGSKCGVESLAKTTKNDKQSSKSKAQKGTIS